MTTIEIIVTADFTPEIYFEIESFAEDTKVSRARPQMMSFDDLLSGYSGIGGYIWKSLSDRHLYSAIREAFEGCLAWADFTEHPPIGESMSYWHTGTKVMLSSSDIDPSGSLINYSLKLTSQFHSGEMVGKNFYIVPSFDQLGHGKLLAILMTDYLGDGTTALSTTLSPPANPLPSDYIDGSNSVVIGRAVIENAKKGVPIEVPIMVNPQTDTTLGNTKVFLEIVAYDVSEAEVPEIGETSYTGIFGNSDDVSMFGMTFIANSAPNYVEIDLIRTYLPQAGWTEVSTNHYSCPLETGSTMPVILYANFGIEEAVFALDATLSTSGTYYYANDILYIYGTTNPVTAEDGRINYTTS
jgi:hypothetical protein